MSASLTGLFLGAGASYEVGLPLVWELTTELKDWLTSDKLCSLNLGWRAQGSGHPDAVIEDVARTLAIPNMHYESILGYLETQYRRPLQFQREYHEQHLQSSRQNSQPSKQIDRSFLSLGSKPFRLKLSRCCSWTLFLAS